MSTQNVTPLPPVSKTSLIPAYQQVAQHIRAHVEAGLYLPNHRLPAEPELATQLQVSRGTLRKGLQSVISDGLLTAVHGKGTFVTALPSAAAFATSFLTIGEEIRRRGKTPATEVIELGRRTSTYAFTALELGGKTIPWYLHRVRGDEDGPIAVMENYLNPTLTTSIEQCDFTTTTLFSYLEEIEGHTISHGERTISSEAAAAPDAGFLDVKIGDPLLVLRQTTFISSGKPIECSLVRINPKRMEIGAIVCR